MSLVKLHDGRYARWVFWIALLLLLSMAPDAHAQSGSDAAWKTTLDQVVLPAVVSLKVTATRDIDTEDAGDTQGTGFVVDAERGLILTNRHMVRSSPVVAEAVFLNHEEVELQAVYRDPVHDFGFYRFDPADVRFMQVSELALAPEAAEVGLDIRVVGNDAGEKLSVLDSTLARLDRAAPDYGGDTYNDFNTFYYQAASGTSGGSSGSPVVDVRGRVVALNAGGRRQAASSFYLPLHRVVRALDLIERGEPVSRGTLQAVFLHQPYDEIRRLGLTQGSEAAFRGAFPAATGALVVADVVPDGPADGALEPGDVLLRLNGALVDGFVAVESVLDASVGEAIRLDIERGGKPISVELTVQDLHGITPDEYLEVGRAVLNDLSYQQARNHVLPIRGVYVAVAGYMLGRAGIPEGALITHVDGVPIDDLDTLQAVLEGKAQGERMIWRYHPVQDPNRDRVEVVTMDRVWYPMNRCARDDATGLWPCVESPPPPDPPAAEEITAVPLQTGDRVGRKLATSLVMVDFDIPHPTAGVRAFNYFGTGVVVDAERGWVLVDRDTVPVVLGDIEIVFAGALRVPGRILYLHPVHNVAVLGYDPALLGDTPVDAVTFSPEPLQAGDKVWQVGMDSSYRLVAQSTRVLDVDPVNMGVSATPRYRDHSFDGVDLVDYTPSVGGVLVDRRGRVQALWASFVDQRENERRFFGLPVTYLSRGVVEHTGVLEPYCAFGAEVAPLPLTDALDRGLSQRRNLALVRHDPIQRRVLEVQRVMGGSRAQQGGLQAGDVLIEVDAGRPRVVTRLDELERLNRAVCGDDMATLTVLRDGHEVEVDWAATPLDGNGTDRAVSWAGLIVHEPHIDVSAQTGIVPDGVYIAWQWYGSPATRYGLRPTRRIIEVDGTPTPDLDAFIAAVQGQEDRQPVRLKMIALDGSVHVQTLKLDHHYWPLFTLERDEDGAWTRR